MVNSTQESSCAEPKANAQIASKTASASAAAESLPFVSIGMPVYNGAPWVRSAVRSLLSQDYANLELIICDNASTDDTAAICREFAEHDARVRYIRSSENIGLWPNFMKALGEARGNYFMWAAHDDQWDPKFVSTLMSQFVRNPALVFAMSYFDRFSHVFDERGTLPLDGYSDIAETRGTFENCAAYLENGCAEFFYGIYRKDALLRTRLVRKTYFDFADVGLIIEILTMGPIHVVQQVLFHAGVTGPRPVKSFARRRLPGFRLSYGEYYRSTARCFLRCRTLTPPQKLRLLGRLTAQVARQVYVYEEIPLLRAVLSRGADVLGVRRSRRRGPAAAGSLDTP